MFSLRSRFVRYSLAQLQVFRHPKENRDRRSKKKLLHDLKLASQCNKKHGIFMPLVLRKIYTTIEQNVIFFPGSIRMNHLPLLAPSIKEVPRSPFILIVRKS